MYVNKVYRIKDCNNGNHHYVRLRAEGEFAFNEFINGEFSVGNTNMSSINRYMLPGGKCVAMSEWDTSADSSVIKEIAPEDDITYDDIRYIAKDCSECNEIAYGIQSCSGDVYYPKNYEDLSKYKGKTVKFSIDNSEYKCGTVISYKKHYFQQIGIITLNDECYKTCEDCGEVKVEEKEEIQIENRQVYAKSFVKSCGGKKCC